MPVLCNPFYTLNQLLFTLQNSTQTYLFFSEVFPDSPGQLAVRFTMLPEPLPPPTPVLEHLWYCVSQLRITEHLSTHHTLDYSKLPLYSCCITQGQENSRQSENVCGMSKWKKELQAISYPGWSGEPLFFCFLFNPFVILKCNSGHGIPTLWKPKTI